jgi:succinate dehydrogenase / fumarate reductase, cytochrome b subunit
MTGMGAFFGSTLGKKVVMAVSGVILVGWIIGHVLGNLLIFRGPVAVNEYAAFLKSNAAFLWGMRVFMLTMVVAHVVAAVQLYRIQRAARPEGYRALKPQASTFSSRSMRIGGFILAVFLVYHILHFTTGHLHPSFSHTNVYGNMVSAFSIPWVAAIYIVAVAALGLHLFHGVWSVFQSLGINHRSINPARRRLATVIAVAVYIGFTAIPIAVLFGLLRAV